MRTFFVEFTHKSSKVETTHAAKFEAESMDAAMKIMKAFAKGASYSGAEVEVTSLAAFKTRGREYEVLV
jgi:hypothetical protein